MKIHKSFVAWWLGAGLCLEVVVAYACVAGDWGCINVLLIAVRIALLGLVFRLLPGLLVAWVPSLAGVTGEACDLAVFRGLTLLYDDVRYTRVNGTIGRDADGASEAVLGRKKVVFALRAVVHAGNTSTIPGPDAQAGPSMGDFVFDKSNDAEQKVRQIGFSHTIKRVAAMPWLGFCVTETSLRGRVALLVHASLLLLAYSACFIFQGYLCATST